jgi:hypothetical protein
MSFSNEAWVILNIMGTICKYLNYLDALFWQDRFVQSLHALRVQKLLVMTWSMKCLFLFKYFLVKCTAWDQITLGDINICQKHLFLNQLTHNMTRDCSLNFLELWVQYMKVASSEHIENMLRTCCVHKLFFCFVIQNNLCTQHVLNMFWACRQ